LLSISLRLAVGRMKGGDDLGNRATGSDSISNVVQPVELEAGIKARLRLQNGRDEPEKFRTLVGPDPG
jgi:hypothetical protein